MKAIIPRNSSGRLGLLGVVALLLLGVAAVAAQSEPQPRSPNEPSGLPEGQTPAGPSAEEMAGRPANELDFGDGASPPSSVPVEEMTGRSANEIEFGDELPPPAENSLPLEEMIGRPANQEDTAQPVPAAPLEGAAPSGSGGTRFLITQGDGVTGALADVQCPAGFHMANLFEIADPTNLTYALVPGAAQKSDQGGGPPTGHYGWVHTGNEASIAQWAGQGNCNLWSSDTASHYGTIVRLSEVWTGSASAISPWQALAFSCSGLAPVWCIED